MTRRRLSLTLAVIGVLIILAAIVAATVVRSNDTATVALGERPDGPVIVTEPGVLDAVHPQVTVRATAGDSEPVVLAVGRSEEVDAWLGDVEHARVTGLSSWEELTVEVVPAAEAPPTDEGTTAPDEAADQAALPDPAGSDLWVAEADGTGTAELSWTDTPGRWSLVAATDGSGPAPEIELEWGREVSTGWLVPGIILGALILAAGVTMIVLDVLARREQRRRDEAAVLGHDSPRSSITDTDPGTGERLTRRQIRELEREMAQADRDRRAGVVDPVPAAPGAIELPDPAEQPPDTTAPHDHDDAEPGADGPDTHETGADGPGTGSRGVDEPGADGPGAHEPDSEGGTGSRDADVLGAAVPAHGPDVDQPDPGDADETDAVATGDPLAPAPHAAEDDDQDQDEEPVAPSWRSVWGFGGTPAPRPAEPPSDRPQADRPQSDDGEERR